MRLVAWAFLYLTFTLTSCALPYREILFKRVAAMNLSQSSMALGLNESQPIVAAAVPSTLAIQWQTSNPSVATVDGTGRVQAVSAGTATITASSADQSIQQTCAVTVYDMNVPTSAFVRLVGGSAVQGDTLNLSGGTMAIDPANGDVYIAYANNTNTGRVFRAPLNSGTWTEIGAGSPFATSIAISASRSQNLSLAINQGTPYIAYVDGASGNVSQVKKFTGTTWTTLAATFASNGAASYLSLAFDSSNTPFLGEIEAGAGSKVTVYKLIAGNWSSIGTNSIGVSGGASTYTSVAFDSTGLVAGTGGSAYLVAYEDSSPAGIEVTNFPAAANLVASVGQTGVYLDSTVQAGTLYVAYQDPSGQAAVFIKPPTGTAVIHPMSVTQADYVSVAADPRNGTAYVAFVDPTAAPAPVVRIFGIRAGTSSGLPGLELVNVPDFQADGVKLGFYVEPNGRGHLLACYGLTAASGGGVVVKDFAR